MVDIRATINLVHQYFHKNPTIIFRLYFKKFDYTIIIFFHIWLIKEMNKRSEYHCPNFILISIIFKSGKTPDFFLNKNSFSNIWQYGFIVFGTNHIIYLNNILIKKKIIYNNLYLAFIYENNITQIFSENDRLNLPMKKI